MTRSKNEARERLAGVGIQPRGLSLEEAAAYVGLSPGAFLKAVAAKLYPDHLPCHGERRIWDRLALDHAMNRLSGLDDHHQPVPDAGADEDIDGAIDRAFPRSSAA